MIDFAASDPSFENLRQLPVALSDRQDAYPTDEISNSDFQISNQPPLGLVIQAQRDDFLQRLFVRDADTAGRFGEVFAE